MTLKSDTKFGDESACCFKIDMRNLANFHQSTRKCQNWDFDGILFVQSRKFMSLKFTEESCVMTMKNDMT